MFWLFLFLLKFFRELVGVFKVFDIVMCVWITILKLGVVDVVVCFYNFSC